MTMLEWTRNPALEEELYARIRRKYETPRAEIHLSDALNCLTKAYWTKTNPIPFDNDTWGLFAIGFALEEVLLKEMPTVDTIQDMIETHTKLAHSTQFLAERIHDRITGAQTPSYEYEGLHFSPDYTTTLIAGEMDLKSTRMWSEEDGRPKYVEDRPLGFPTGWLKQFMGYAHRLGAQPGPVVQICQSNPDHMGWRHGPDDERICTECNSYVINTSEPDYVDYSVGIMYLGAGKLIAGTIRFAWDDVEENMALALYRAAILEDQLKLGEPPVPFMYNEAWECKNCPYLSRCKSHG